MGVALAWGEPPVVGCCSGVADRAASAGSCPDPLRAIEHFNEDDILETEVGGTLLRHWVEKRRLERELAEADADSEASHKSVGLPLRLEQLATTCGVLGMPDRQLQLLDRALGLHQEMYGSTHPRVAQVLSRIAEVHEGLGAFPAEVDLRERAFAVYERLCSDSFTPAVAALHADAAAALAEACGRMGDQGRQHELLERALELEEKHFGSEHCRAARVLAKLGQGDDLRASIASLQRALGILQAEYTGRHPLVVELLESLARAHGALGELLRQKEYLERALAFKEPLYGLQHPEVAATLVRMGAVYGRLGEDTEREELLHRAVQIIERGCASLAPRAPLLCLESPAAASSERHQTHVREAEARLREAKLWAEHKLLAQADSVTALAVLDEARRGSPDDPGRWAWLMQGAAGQLQEELGPEHRYAVRARAALAAAAAAGACGALCAERPRVDEQAELPLGVAACLGEPAPAGPLAEPPGAGS